MRNIFFIGIGLFVIMLSSCRSHRQVVQQTSSDSTSITFREVEKIVHLEGDTVAASMQATVSPGSGEKEISFTPQTQIIETKRTSVKIELTKSGEIRATAISKELDEKVTVQEKTIKTSKNTVTVLEEKPKDNWFKRTFKNIERTFKTVLITVLIIAGLLAWFRFSGIIKSFISKLIK